jgi:hypothetical protein
MKILLKRVGQPYEFTEIDNTLEAMQATVGGYIECVRLRSSMVCICDEEGLLKSKQPNTQVRVFGGYKTIVGDLFICNVDGEEFAGIHPDADFKEVVRAVDENEYMDWFMRKEKL